MVAYLHRGVEQLVARQAHNLEVIRSSRVSATLNRGIQKMYSSVFFLIFLKSIVKNAINLRFFRSS